MIALGMKMDVRVAENSSERVRIARFPFGAIMTLDAQRVGKLGQPLG